MMAETYKGNHMTLAELLKGIVDVHLDLQFAISQLVLDSRQVQAGDVFLAIPGKNVDGRDYIEVAIEHGARAVLWECEKGSVPIPIAWRQRPSGTKVPVIAIEDLTHKVGVLADRFYQQPSKSMYVVGITGTNGKTTCSQFVAQAIDADSHCAVMGTMGWGFLGELHVTTHTTPDAIRCHQWLDELLQQGAKSVAMEVSSHALDQSRVTGVNFDCVVFTNLSHDHLDYHGDMESYGQAKQKLFLLQDNRHHVINVDDAFGIRLSEQLPVGANCIRYSIDNLAMADIWATNIYQTDQGLKFTLQTADTAADVKANVYGRFNIYNLLATAGVMLSMGYELTQIARRLALISGVSGRLQVLRNAKQPVFVIDYAHTPDALENVLLAIKAHFQGRLWCVIGCGGDRDKQKRPKMAAIAETNADQVIITSDNPRSESPQAIVEDMLAGMRYPDKAIVELDRKAAIAIAFEHASADEVILVAGKGHENYQLIGDKKFPFSDQAEIEQLLSEVRHG